MPNCIYLSQLPNNSAFIPGSKCITSTKHNLNCITSTYRYYSHQWRTWAACFIQATWRQQKRRRASIELRLLEGGSVIGQKPHNPDIKEKTADVFSGKLITNRRNGRRSTAHVAKSLKKPTEPDFTIQEENE
jgi:cyclic nucleotide gated channel, plant